MQVEASPLTLIVHLDHIRSHASDKGDVEIVVAEKRQVRIVDRDGHIHFSGLQSHYPCLSIRDLCESNGIETGSAAPVVDCWTRS